MKTALVTFADDVDPETIRAALAGLPVIDVESSDPELSDEEIATSPFRVKQDGDTFIVVEVDAFDREVWRASMAWPDQYAAKQHWRAATAAWSRRQARLQEEVDQQGSVEAQVIALRPKQNASLL